MIYRINPSIKKYKRLHLDGKAARKALGPDTEFYFDDRPISYLKLWMPMEVDFYDAYGAGAKTIPDISTRAGKMFMSEAAYNALKDILSPHGEWLPVIYKRGAGFIFNCLDVAETYDAVNEKLSIHDPLNGRFSIVFDENKLTNVNIFRTQMDYDGFFCQSEVKEIVEREKLVRVEFTEDLGNPFPSDLDMMHRH